MVVLLNCSFRGEKSNSNYFLGLLEQQLDVPCERISLAKMKNFGELKRKLAEADALVLGMPLYVDSVPAQVIDMMERLYEEKSEELKKLHVYVVTNLGFYEASQTKIELAVVKNWCDKMGMTYGGGLAIGAGEMMGSLRNVPADQGPNREMGEGLKTLATAIKERAAIEDIYTEPTGFPRRMYLMAAQMNWAPQAKKFGNKKRDILRKRP